MQNTLSQYIYLPTKLICPTLREKSRVILMDGGRTTAESPSLCHKDLLRCIDNIRLCPSRMLALELAWCEIRSTASCVLTLEMLWRCRKVCIMPFPLGSQATRAVYRTVVGGGNCWQFVWHELYLPLNSSKNGDFFFSQECSMCPLWWQESE